MDLDLTSRPQLPAADQKRAEHQALRSRLLSGLWSDDLEHALDKHIKPERRAAWGIAEMSRNPFRSLSTQVGGALYSMPPILRGPTGGEGLLATVQASGYFQLMQRVSTDLVGIREALVRVDWTERGGLLHRPIPGELCIVRSRSEAPDVPVAVEELQSRTNPKTGKPAWAWEVLDVDDLDNPVHVILSADRKEDWTEATLKGLKSGANYQYRDMAGKPYLPVGMYHAERTGNLWDSYYGVEAVLGTLTVGVLLTFWVHGVKDGSFATVLLVGGRIVGMEITSPSGTKTQVISTEPGSFIEVSPIEEGVQPSALQIQPGFDPEKLMGAISGFEQGLAEYAGVSAADLVRTGADPRSGASLSISREGLRASQARYEPQLRRGDLGILEISAKVLNGATSTKYPETGYSISYPSLPLSSGEVAAQTTDIVTKIAHGLMSKVDGYMRLHPGLSREQAVLELQRIQRENLQFPGPAPAPTFPS